MLKVVGNSLSNTSNQKSFPSLERLSSFGERIRYFARVLLACYCIFAGETAKLVFITELKDFGDSGTFYLSMLMSLSLIFVPWVGVISDKNCRKRTLIFTFIFGLVALVVFFRSPLTSSIIQGILGAAIVPVSRALHLDFRSKVSERWVIALAAVETVIAQAIAWSFYSFYSQYSLMNISIAMFLVAIIFLIPCKSPDKGRIIKHEFSKLRKKHLLGFSFQLLMAFFVFDLIFQLPNYYFETHIKAEAFDRTLSFVGSGILIGSLLTWIVIFYFGRHFHKKIKATQLLNILYKGILVSSVFLLLVFFIPSLTNFPYSLSAKIDQPMIFTFCSVGGIILALTFVYFGERAISHERGLMFCILEEIETIAESIVPVMILALPKHTYLNTTPFNVIILIGVLCILRRFKQTSSNQSF